MPFAERNGPVNGKQRHPYQSADWGRYQRRVLCNRANDEGVPRIDAREGAAGGEHPHSWKHQLDDSSRANAEMSVAIRVGEEDLAAVQSLFWSFVERSQPFSEAQKVSVLKEAAKEASGRGKPRKCQSTSSIS